MGVTAAGRTGFIQEPCGAGVTLGCTPTVHTASKEAEVRDFQLLFISESLDVFFSLCPNPFALTGVFSHVMTSLGGQLMAP